MKSPIYMDNHATTRVDPRVVEAMLPYFGETFGNAASRNHEFGWRAEQAVEAARGQIARLIAAAPKEIVFTSGATESNNLALKGLALRRVDRGDHIITCVTEHKAVLDPCRRLEQEGFRISYLPVGRDGLLDVERLADAISPKTILISVMYANNETGVIQPIGSLGRIARERGIAFHVDASQAVGKISVDVQRDAIDLLSFTAHKLYGPKGIGALYVRRRAPRVEIAAQMDGGGHERGMRSGTLNVPAIVGFGRACAICGDEMAAESARLAALRDRLKDGLFERIGEIAVNGSLEHRLPHNLSVCFAHVDGESLLMGLAPEVAVSSGSACTSATPEPSHVLRAMGVPERLAHSSIRFGLGRFNTIEEVDHVIGKVEEVIGRLRELSPRFAAARK